MIKILTNFIRNGNEDYKVKCHYSIDLLPLYFNYIKTMFSSSSPLVVCRRAHVLFVVLFVLCYPA